MKAITVLGYRRPTYLKKCLKALYECRGIEEYEVRVYVDGGSDKSQDCLAVAAKYTRKRFLQPTNFGINLHNFIAYNDALSNTRVDFLVAVEDDAVLSPDALELANWYYDFPLRNRYEFLSLGRISKESGDPSAVHEFAGLGTSWAWCFTRESWKAMGECWNCKVIAPVGWDWSVTYQLYRKLRLALVPEVSRVTNIGREGGVNAYPEWFDQNMVGLTASDGSFRGQYHLGELLPVDWNEHRPSWVVDEDRIRC